MNAKWFRCISAYGTRVKWHAFDAEAAMSRCGVASAQLKDWQGTPATIPPAGQTICQRCRAKLDSPRQTSLD